MVLGKLDKYMQKMKLHHLLTPHIRINLKWIKDLNVRLKTVELLEENIGSKISDISHSNIFSGISPWVRETKEKENKWDYIKVKIFAQQRKPSTKHKKNQPTEWEKIFTSAPS